jgi:PilZ domain
MTESDPQNRRRSQRVLLQVPVLVRARLPEGTPVQSQAFTQVVNAHGGLIEVSFRMTTGQKVRLVNPHSRKEVGCHVVWVGGPSDGNFPTGFEFDEPNPRFWGIDFPPADWCLAQEVTDENR